MANGSMIFNIPAVEGFCRAVRTGVAECGGSEGFFKTLTENTRETFRKVLPDGNDQRIFVKLLNDPEYYTIFLNQIIAEEDKRFMHNFFQGWKIWSESFPLEAEEIRLALVPTVDVLLNGPVPRVVNDVISCLSLIDLEAYAEAFMVKSILRLSSANKEIGGPNALVMAGRLTSLLGTITIMLNSLRLRGTEVGLFKVPEDKNAVVHVLTQLDQIERAIVDLRTQFENMKQKI